MNLTLREKDKLLVSVAAMVTERRLRRGVKLNYPEAVALITDFVLEGARDGKTVAELMRDGATVIAREQVMEGVAEMIERCKSRQPFPTGPSSSPSTSRSAEGTKMTEIRRASPSTASLRSAPSPAVRERGYNGFGSKLLSRTVGEGGTEPAGLGG